jgi:hypothetical protein
MQGKPSWLKINYSFTDIGSDLIVRTFNHLATLTSKGKHKSPNYKEYLSKKEFLRAVRGASAKDRKTCDHDPSSKLAMSCFALQALPIPLD